jgi:lipopolysaccharide/colanic/teichoic acid biosynthesis glycosyltransferase
MTAVAEREPQVLGPADLIGARRGRAAPPVGVLWPACKRAVDLVGATMLLAVLSPILVLVAVAVRLDSPGPALFRQRRLGRELEPFTLLKFRTMHDGVSSEAHRRYVERLVREPEVPAATGLCKLGRDLRVTRVGRLLRRTSIDELPQLVNVLRGEMSLVGPRPALGYELEHYRRRHYLRFAVRPGLTGLWQVSGRSRLGFVEMLDLDVRYVRECRPGLDAQILLRTPQALLDATA